MGQFSLMHWIVVLVVVLVLFGPRRLPELGSGLGSFISNFKKGLRGSDSEPKDPTTIDTEKKE